MDKQETIDMVLGNLLDTASMIVDDGPHEDEDVAFDLALLVLEVRDLIRDNGYPIPTAWKE